MSNFVVNFLRLLTCLILLSLRVYSLDDDGSGKENRKSTPESLPAAQRKKGDHVLESPDRRKTPLKVRDDSALDSQKPLAPPILAPMIEKTDDDNQSDTDMFNPIGSRQAVQLDDSRLYTLSPNLFANMGGTQENLPKITTAQLLAEIVADRKAEENPKRAQKEFRRRETSGNNSGEYGFEGKEESSQHAFSEESNSDDEYESDGEVSQVGHLNSPDTKGSSVEKFSSKELFALQAPESVKKTHSPMFSSDDFFTQMPSVKNATPRATQVDSPKSDVAGKRPSLRRLRVITPEPVPNNVVYSPEILASSPIVLDDEIPNDDFLDEFNGSPSQSFREDTESEEEEDLNGQFNDFSSIQNNTQENVQEPAAGEDVVIEDDEEAEVPAVNSKPKPRMHGDFVSAAALMKAQAAQKPQAQVTPKAPVNPVTEMMSTKNRRTAFAPARPKSTDPHQHQVGWHQSKIGWHQSKTGTGNLVLTLESGSFGTLMIPKDAGDVFKLAYSGWYPVLRSCTLEEAKKEAEELLPQLEAEKRQADLQRNLYQAELAKKGVQPPKPRANSFNAEARHQQELAEQARLAQEREESERARQARLAKAAAKKAEFKKGNPPK